MIIVIFSREMATLGDLVNRTAQVTLYGMQLISWVRFIFTILKSNFVDLKHPYKYFLVVTKSCGSRCGNCFIWKEKPENELSLAEFEAIARNAGKNLFWLNISGGEPTDRKDLGQIIQIFIQHCPNLLCLNFTTNALNLTELEKVSSLLQESRVPIVRINVSVDGPEKMHNTLRGTPDGFNSAVAALNNLRRFKKIKVMANMTIYPTNQSSVEETVKVLQEKIPGFKRSDLHLALPQSSGHFYRNDEINYQGKLNGELIRPQALSLSLFKQMEKIYLRNVKKHLSTGKSPITCAALSGNVYISEKGEIYPCTKWNAPVANLRNEDYDMAQVFTKTSHQELRSKIKDKTCPGCWTPCEAYPSIASSLKESLLTLIQS